MTGLQVAAAALVGGLLALERKSLAQLMLSRPIVAAPLMGALLGNASLGLQLGVPLELFYLGASSYGVSNPHQETLAALFAGALVASAGVSERPALLTIVFVLALLLGWLGKYLDEALERWNGGLVDRAERSVAEGQLRRSSLQLLIGLAGPFLVGATAAAFATLLGPVLGPLTDSLPTVLERGLSHAWLLLLGLSGALAIRSLKATKPLRYAGAGALAVALVYGATIAIRSLR